MFESSVINMGVYILDLSAFLLLAGMIVYTKIYRQRGRLDDRIFFILLVLDMITAVFDVFPYCLENSGIPLEESILRAGNSIFWICIAVLPMLFVLYLDYLLYKDEERTKRIWKWLVLPVCYSVVLTAANLFLNFLYYKDEAGSYHFGDMYFLVYVPVYIYSVIIIALYWKHSKKMVAACLVLMAARMVLRLFMGYMSSTVFIFAVLFVYAHVYAMNEEFYGEETA